MKYRFLVLLFICSFFSVNASEMYKKNYMLKLESGETIHVDGIEVVYAGKTGEWVMLMRYFTNNISDIAIQCERAKLLWPSLKPKVEAKGWDWAGIKSVQLETESVYGPIKKSEHKAYTILYKRDKENDWQNFSDVCD